MVEKKELKELLAGLLLVAMEGVKVGKDGLQASDITAVLQDLFVNEENRKVLISAISGVSGVAEEIKAFTVADWIDLVIWLSAYIPKFVESLKK